ncbi:MAG: mechanosensitive ion channel family protein [Ruminococcus sp.]|nr:mechanosensitive ion channel family protein [Ruminococcus sp.]
MGDKILNWLETYGPMILAALLIFIIGIIASKIILKILSRALKKSRLDPTGHAFLVSIIKVALYALVVIITLSKLSVPMTSIIAVLSAAGLAISLALKENLSNVAGGFILMFTRPFTIGDYISVSGAEGFVTEITIMHTKMATIDNKSVMIPNAAVTNSVITNYTVEDKRRLEQHYTIAYSADFNKAKEAILSVIRNDERFLAAPDAPMIVMDGHKNSSIGVMLRVWVNQKDYWPAYYDLYRLVKEAFDREGVEIPFDQLDVHLDGLNNALPGKDQEA